MDPTREPGQPVAPTELVATRAGGASTGPGAGVVAATARAPPPTVASTTTDTHHGGEPAFTGTP